VAGYNEIQVGRFNRMLQKLLSMKGPASMNELSSTLQPAVGVFSGAENRFLESWFRYGVWLNAAAVAGNLSEAFIRNPTGSNVIAVIEKLSASSIAGTVQTMTVSYGQPGLVDLTLQTGRSLDGRNAGSPVLKTSFGSTLGGRTIGTNIESARGADGTTADFILTDNQEITLSPGDALQVEDNGANIAMFVSIIWRERFLEDSERS